MTNQMAIGVNREDNTTRNVAIGAGVGAIAGGAYGHFVPAKYSSFADLAAEATSGDTANFKLAQLAEGATDAQKAVYNAADSAIKQLQADKTTIEGMFTNGVSEVSLDDALKKLNLTPSTAEEINAKKVAEYINKQGLENVGNITDEVAASVLGEGKKVADFTSIADTLKDKDAYTKEKIDAAIDAVAQKGVADKLAEAAKEGKVTREAVVEAATSRAAATKGLENFADNAAIFGKGGWKNIAKYGAIGLAVAGVAAWAYSKFFGSKDAA